jgi:exonuclease-1
MKDALRYFARAVDVTPRMAAQLIQRLRPMGFECIVAPYEADAQLAYLSLSGYISAVISEDSDLLVYGCAQVLYKLDSNGYGSLIRLSDLPSCASFDFRSWSQDRFCWMCVLSGCDYLCNIKSVGLRSAYRIALRSTSVDQVPVYVRSEVVFNYEPNFDTEFYKAVLVFRHQRVYDPINQEMVHLTPLSDQDRELLKGDTDFLGP